MNGIIKRTIINGLSLSVLAFTPISATFNSHKNELVSDFSQMTDKQKNSIAMLNYMTVLTQEINSSSNSKIFLDATYSEIVNNTNPNAVDSTTNDEIQSLLDTIQSYQSIQTKRERLTYVYEQNQAKALKEAIPNPVGLLSLAESGDPLKAIVSVAYMAIDSKASYDSYMTEVEKQYLEDGWELDDEASENLHDSRKDAFSYMVSMCNDNEIDGSLALTEDTVKDFVKYENNTNLTRKIEFFEKNQETYKAYGKYWLVLAEAYYEDGNYRQCINCINKYNDLGINIFRKDKDYAKALTMAIVSADELYSDDKYEEVTTSYLEQILDNIETEDDWSLRYFVSSTYFNLYSRTNKKIYLNKAFENAEENVNYLVDEQRAKNKTYLADVKTVESKSGDTKVTKNEIKQYNKMLKEERKTELPPVYEPLLVNCELLFSIADEMNVSDSEKNKVNKILHENDKPLFLIEELDKKFWFNAEEVTKPDITFDGTTLVVPATYVYQDSTITLKVGKNEYTDWKVNKVDRKDKADVNKYFVTYTSDKIKKQEYNEKSKVSVSIGYGTDDSSDKLSYKFKTKKTKSLFVLDKIIFEME